MNIALIVFAGSGTRINSCIPKQFIKINDQELVIYTIRKFNDNPHIDEIVLVTSKEFLPMVEHFKDKYNLEKIVKIVEGGASRQESVKNGLLATDYDPKDNILIHDGDRPLVGNAIINQCIQYLDEYDATCPFVFKSDELLEVSNSGRKSRLENKEIDIQTPHAFKYGLIKQKHTSVSSQVSDDISLVENDNEVKYFVGDKHNFKVTTDQDLEYLEKYLEKHHE